MIITGSDKKEVLTRMFVDPFFFAQTLFGDKNNPMHYHLRTKSPRFHHEIMNTLLNLDPGDKLAVVAPRGHAKTTLVSLIYPLHQILFGCEHFLLLISESETQSKYLLEAIGNEIEFNEKIHHYFGNRMGETWGKEEKIIIGDFNSKGMPTKKCKVLIRGTGQKVRGLKFGAYRPTLTLIDDGEGESNSSTLANREKFRRWLNGAVIPGSQDAKLAFVGTIVDDESYLNYVAGPKAYTRDGKRKVKGWKSLFYQAIKQDAEEGNFVSSGKEVLDSNGVPEVLWKELRPHEWLVKERDRLKSEGDVGYFYQEYQNFPLDDSFRIFKKSNIQYWQGHYVHEDGLNFIMRTDEGRKVKIPVNIFIGVDPASSENVKADYTAIIVIGVDKDWNFYTIDLYRGQVAPMDGANKILEFADKYLPKAINIEETGHVMLQDYIRRVCKQTGRFYSINPKKAIKAKYYRIKQLEPYFSSKAVFLKHEHYDLEQELLAFREHGTFKKDTLDALRWSIDDVFPPSVDQMDDGVYYQPQTQVITDWQTGQVLTGMVHA